MSAYDKKPVFLIALALLVACTSCGHDDPDVPPTPTEPDKPAAQIPINISATITRATEEAFESGDRIGLFVVNRNADGSVRSLTPYKDGAVYHAFVVPQTAMGNNLITITVDGTDHNISKTVTFVGGKRHTLTATLSKEGGGLNVSISAWESDGIDYGGVAS